MNCSQCKTENIEEAACCLHCGYRFKEESEPLLWTGVRRKICSSCFLPSYASAVFCIRCGTKLPDQENKRQSYISQEKIFSKLLVDDGIISNQNRIEIEEINKNKAGYSFMDTLITSQFARENEVLAFLSKKLHVPYVPIADFTKKMDNDFSKMIPEGVARRQNILVVSIENNVPVIAMSDPISIPALMELRSILTTESYTVICSSNDIKKTFDDYYPKKAPPPKISSAAQIDAYDIDSINMKPTLTKDGKQDSLIMTNTGARILKHRRTASHVWGALFLSFLVMLGIGGGVTYMFKDRLMLPIHLQKGNAYFKDRNYELAIKEYNAYLKYKPQDTDVHFKIAKAYDAQEQYLEAMDHFTIVTAKKPRSVEAHYYAGLSSFNYQGYTQAIESFKKVLQLDPKKIDAYKYIGLAHMHLGDMNNAIPFFEKTIAYGSKEDGITQYLIKAYLDAKKYSNVINLSRTVLKEKGDVPETHYYLGYATAATGDFANAITQYKQSMLFSADSAETHLKKGFSLKDEKKYDEAISEYIKVLAIEENNPEAYNNLGIIYKKKGYTQSSNQCSSKAKRILRIQ